MITDFNIATDVKVEFFAPDETGNIFIIGVSAIGGRDVLAGSGTFIIGVSLLGGTDVLSGESAFDWQAVECEVTSADISLGGSIEGQWFFQPEPGTLNLEMQSWVFDPSNSSAIRPGTPIRVRLDDGVVNETLFSGFLDTINVSYYPGPEQPNVISITAYDGYKRFVNTRIADFDTTGLPAAYATPLDVFEEVSFRTGLALSASSDDLVGKLPKEQVFNSTAAIFVNDATQVGLGLVWIDPESGELVLKARPENISSAPPGTYTIGNNHGEAYHLCMSDIEVSGQSDDVTNSLYLDLSTDDTVNVTLEDTDSIELYGYASTDLSINTTDLGELTAWGNRVFAGGTPKYVRSVETPAIDRLGTLTDVVGFMPGTLIKVNYDTPNILIEDFYTVTKVSHSIDVNNWYTTLELWKDF